MAGPDLPPRATSGSAGARRLRRVAAVMLLLLTASACDRTTPEQHLAEARTLMASNEYRRAVIELKNAIQKDRALASARLALGEAYLATGDFSSALIELERALDLGADEMAARLGLLRAKLGLNRVQEVIGELADASGRTVDEGLLLGEAYVMAGNFGAARPLFEAGRDRAAGLAGLAAVFWSEGNLTQARALYAQAIEKDPNTASYWLRQAELELRESDFEQAAASFAAAARLPLGRVLGQVGEVRTLIAQEQLPQAAERIDRVLELAPDYPLAKYLKGLIAYQQDDVDGAELALRDVQTSFPDHAPTLYLMGLVKFKQGQPAQAERNLQRFLNTNPNNLSARKLLATLFSERGEPNRAAEILQPMAGRTKDPQLLAMLGSALMQMGRTAEATEYLQAAVALDPEGASFRNQLALSLLSAGEDELAMAQLEAAVEVDGQQFQSDYLQALVSLRKGELTRAETAIANLSAKAPESPIGPNLMGAVAIARNQPDVAEARFREALERDPAFAPARNNLVRLYESQDDSGKSVTLLQERVAQAPSDYAARLALAELQVRQGDLDAAREQLLRVVSLKPALVTGRLALSRVHLLLGDAGPAREVLDEGLVTQERNIDLLAAKADLQLQLGEQEAASATTRKLQATALNLAPNPALNYAIGALQLRLGELEPAEKNLARAIELAGGENPLAELDLASVLLRQQKTDEAAAIAQSLAGRVDADSPAAPRLQLLQADVLLARNELGKASAIYQSLSETGNRQGTLRLAAAELRSGNAAAGIGVLRGWLDRNPADQAARILLAGALLGDGQNDAAVVEYEALEDSGNPVVLNNLAWLYQQKGNKRAVELGRKAYEASPGNADVADTYGWILIEQERLAEGVKLLKESVQLRPGNPTALYHLAYALNAQDQPEEARAPLAQALQAPAFPERELAQALLRELAQ